MVDTSDVGRVPAYVMTWCITSSKFEPQTDKGMPAGSLHWQICEREPFHLGHAYALHAKSVQSLTVEEFRISNTDKHDVCRNQPAVSQHLVITLTYNCCEALSIEKQMIPLLLVYVRSLNDSF
jgi:hypothetical protein